jgi:hypothetical protein
MPLTIDKNMSAAQYISILKSIERGTATYTQWDQLTKPMVQVLPWCLLQDCPKGLAEAQKQLAAAEAEQAEVDKFFEAENALFDNNNHNKGVEWDEDAGCWVFTTLHSPDLSTPDADEEDVEPLRSFSPLPPQRSQADLIEEHVLAHIATIHACAAPTGHGCLRILYHSSKRRCGLRRNRKCIYAFRQLKDFTSSQFGNVTSSRRQEYTTGDVVATGGDGLVKVDSWRLANAWYEQLDKKVKRYDMEGISMVGDGDERVVVRGPRELAEEEY